MGFYMLTRRADEECGLVMAVLPRDEVPCLRSQIVPLAAPRRAVAVHECVVSESQRSGPDIPA